MTKYKIQTLESLRNEMIAVARGDRPAPPDAAKPSFNSVDALVRLLTPENREEAAGFIAMKINNRRKAPSVVIKKITVEIDPYSDHDRLSVA